MRPGNSIIASCIMLTLSVSAAGTTNGVQTFRLLFKAGDVVWIGEDIGGEYEQSELHQIVLSEDSVTDGKSTLKTFSDWSAVEALRGQLRIEPVIPLSKQADGIWIHSELKWTITAPPREAALAEAFSRHIQAGGSDARSFYTGQNSTGWHNPIIQGAMFKPLFFSRRGLFFNYDIESACFFARSGLLLVFIDQPAKAVGLDTMHGFLIMKLQPKGNKPD